MKPKRFREIALLTLPVLAIVAVVPGARWVGEWREANKVPRIEAFELRAPTPLENYLGAEAGFTARLVAPETKNSDHHMNLRMEIRNEAGRRWNGQGKTWDGITRSSRITFPDQGSSKLWIIESGLRWSEIVGAGKTAQINIVFEEVTSASPQVFSRAARQIRLRNDLPPSPFVPRSNFVIERVGMVSMTALGATESENKHEITLTVRRDGASQQTNDNRSWTSGWRLAATTYKDATSTPLEFVSLSEKLPTLSEPSGEKDLVQLQLTLKEDSPLRGRASRLRGALSLDQGWPQNIVIELPQGLPARLPFEQVDLPFTATLAPLPK